MTKPATAALFALTLAACQPPPPVPPPRFKPNPPHPPEIVDDTAPEHPGEGYETTTPPAEPTRPGEYPVATPTGTPNEVNRPFPPYNRIDVEGFQSGQLARDPSNNQIFRVP